MKSLRVGDKVIVGKFPKKQYTREGLYIASGMRQYEGLITTISSRYPTGDGRYRYYIKNGNGCIWDSTLIRPFNNNHNKGGKLL